MQGMQVQTWIRGTKVPHTVWLSQKKRKKAPHAHPAHCASPCVWNQDQSNLCAVSTLPNSLSSLPLIIKLPTPTSADLILSHWKDSYRSHNTNTSHRDEPHSSGWAICRPPPSPRYRDWCRAQCVIQANQEFLLGIYLTGVGEKETLFSLSGGKGIDM